MFELYVTELELKWYVKNVKKREEIQAHRILVPAKVAVFWRKSSHILI